MRAASLDLLRRGAPWLSSVAVAGVWVVLALRSPTVTYHLVPGLAAAVWPLVARIRSGPASVTTAARAAAGGLGVALVATAVLAAAGALDGPTLVGGSGAVEAVLVAVAGSLWGARTMSRPRPGLVVRLLDSGSE